MGFKIAAASERLAVLVFEGDYKGAEVTVRLNVPMRVFIEARRVAASQDWEPFLAYFVAEVVRGWNLENADGQPVPVTSDGLASVPLDFLMRLITEWANQVGSVAAPLVSASSNGRPSVEASLPMANS